MKLLIGGSSSKMFHLEEFAAILKKNKIDVKLVLDIDYADGFPSRKIGKWLGKNNEFEKLIEFYQKSSIIGCLYAILHVNQYSKGYTLKAKYRDFNGVIAPNRRTHFSI